MATIPVMIVFDGETIVSTFGQGGSESAPITINSSNCVYMIAQGNYVVNSQANYELKIKAEPEDIIQWRATAVDRTDYSPILTQFVVSSGTSLIGTAQQNQPTLYYYLSADPSNPDNGVRQTSCLDAVWQATVLSPGKVTYRWRFKLLDREGSVLGYYTWDPYIQINQPGT